MATKASLSHDDYVSGLLAGDRTVLARAITLIESSKESDRALAGDLLGVLLQRKSTGTAIRIGFSGAPGVGKSSLIEAFGLNAIESGKRVAVLAIDPSGIVSGGSILGDKVRMAKLSLHDQAFIRPSPARGYLGGVAQTTHESIVLCEAAGYDVVIIETVGVGQSEYTVRQLVDVFVLLLMAGAGDDLQTIKRGILECFDILAVTKCDGNSEKVARRYARDLREFLPQLKPATPGWMPVCLETSSLSLLGVDLLWSESQRFYSELSSTGLVERLRTEREVAMFNENLKSYLAKEITELPIVASLIGQKKERLLPTSPARVVIDSITKDVIARIVR